MGVYPQHRTQRHRLFQAGRRWNAAVQPEPIRRRARWPDHERQDFLFGDYEGFRRVYHPLQFATVPTVAMEQGDFSAYGVPIVNPLTGRAAQTASFPHRNSRRSQRPLSPRCPRRICRAFPITTNRRLPTPSTTIKAISGATTIISPRLTLFARYSQFETRIFSPPNIPGPAGGNSNGNVYIQDQTRVSPAPRGLSVRPPCSKHGWESTIHEAGRPRPRWAHPTSGFTIPGEPTDPSLAGGLFSVGLSGFSALGRQSSNPQYQDPFVGDPKVNYTKIVGRHSLKWALSIQLIDTAVSDFHPQYGTENFTGYFSDPAAYQSQRGQRPEQQQQGSL